LNQKGSSEPFLLVKSILDLLPIFFYNKQKEIIMSSENTINALHQWCKKTCPGVDATIWQGKNGTYQWNRGRDSLTGMINGVVRKLAGIAATGRQIWVVAGSFKIDPDGTITRFTGIPKKEQAIISRMGQIAHQASLTVKESEYDITTI